MKRILFFLVLNYFGSVGYAQKKELDEAVLNTWPYINNAAVSNNGRYVIYYVTAKNASPVLVIQSIDRLWKREFLGAINAIITVDSRFVVFQSSKDSVRILQLGCDDIRTIAGANSFKLSANGKQQWLAYQSNAGHGALVLLNLENLATQQYAYVKDYRFSTSGNDLLLQAFPEKINADSCSKVLVVWVHLPEQSCDTIMKSNRIASNFVFDAIGRQITFLSEGGLKDHSLLALMYYKIGMDSAVEKVVQSLSGNQDDLVLSNTEPRFSDNGNKIIFYLHHEPHLRKEPTGNTVGVKVDIWKYQDQYLPPQQVLQMNTPQPKEFTAIMSVVGTKAIQVNKQGDDWDVRLAGGGDSAYALVFSKTNLWEMDWRKTERPVIYLVSTKDGSRKIINEHFHSPGIYCHFSPRARYVIWYDREKGDYFTYNISTGSIKDITQHVSAPLYDDEDEHPRRPFSFGIAGWLVKDSSVFIYDRYDIWEIDPDGKKPPVNLTNGFGRKNKIMLRYLPFGRNDNSGDHIFQFNEKIFLVAFNRTNKENGFFFKQLGTALDPKILTMGPYVYYFPQITISSFTSLSDYPIVKAISSDTYIVQRMSSCLAPNYFVTRDFIEFHQLSENNPQDNYIWIKSELVHWKINRGITAEGILYKPDNFDPKRKYPIIFSFYEKNADRLNRFIYPVTSEGPLNISYFVARGYLVFDPNIYYKNGRPGESACNAVISAARYLSRRSWVDRSRMGLDGHSFGGYEVNYIITHTQLFRAAVSAAGPSDLVSLYGGLRKGVGVSNQFLCETGQMRLGTTLWQDPALFIKNSPVFYANRVTTPLLILQNQNDGAVSWEQGVEFFLALRRLGKKVWMLQYDGEDHTIDNEMNQMDFTIRVEQFFDYYLKGSPSPMWMKNGAEASGKPVDKRY